MIDDSSLEAHWHTLAATVSGSASSSDGFSVTIRSSATPPLPACPRPRLRLSDPRQTNLDRGSAEADFDILELLGEGGMGRIQLALQNALEREVALKTVKDDRPQTEAQLGAEALAMGRVEHPNVIPVHMIGLDERDRLVLVMKRVAGVDWRALLRDPEHPHWEILDIPKSERMEFHLGVLAQVANALHFAHSRRVVHRDLKPENVMIGSFGEVYLVDWGIALREQESSSAATTSVTYAVIGTPAYMAPEQASGQLHRQGPHTDVYLLGSTLHEILTGRPRHCGDGLAEVLTKAYESQAYEYPPEIPDELAALANRATAHDPADRPASALAFRRSLDGYRRHRGSLALAQAAARRLEQASSTTDNDEIERVLVESRFGFMQALQEWPENREARIGLTSCLDRLIRRDLERENVEGARALLTQLRDWSGDAAEAFAADVAALARRVEERRVALERAAAREREVDFELGLRQRTWMMIGLFVVMLATSTYVLRVRYGSSGGSIEHSTMLAFTLAPALVYAGVVVLARRAVLANAANRNFTALVGLVLGSLLIHRLVSWHIGIPVITILCIDQFLLGLILAAGSLALPNLRRLVPHWLLAGVISTLWPTLTNLAFTSAFLLTFLILFVRWDHMMRGKVQ